MYPSLSNSRCSNTAKIAVSLRLHWDSLHSVWITFVGFELKNYKGIIWGGGVQEIGANQRMRKGKKGRNCGGLALGLSWVKLLTSSMEFE